MRRLPYGANYLDWEDMSELREAVDGKILFRYQTTNPSISERLERHIEYRFGARHALAVHNCTEGLRLCLLATQPRVGDLVYVPAVTFVAVVGAVLSCGLIPVVVDVDEDFHLDPRKLPEGASRVIVAHMEGLVGPLPRGPAFVIEDAAQALGGRHGDGRCAGAAGWAGVFSFHHNKVLTSGEGGAVITNDSRALERMRMYHDHGSERVHGEYPRWSDSAFYGENCVTSEPIAAIQCQQFRHLDTILEGLWRGYRFLREEMEHARPLFVARDRKQGDVPVSLRIECESREARDRAVDRLRARRLPYWTLDRYFLPDHPVMTLRRSIYADGFPWNLSPSEANTPACSRTRDRLERVLCLPISPELSEREHVAEAEAFRAALASL